MRKSKNTVVTLGLILLISADCFMVQAKANISLEVADDIHKEIPIVEKPPLETALNTTGEEGPDILLKDGQSLNIGEQVVAFASQFIGNPYVYGGTSLTEGADCSGFVMSVYKQFGISLPRTSSEQGLSGKTVDGIENAKPGDLVSYEGHIGIYMGQNQLVHASTPEDGIKVSPVTYKPILSIRRIIY
ncbi:C40 family peptidase [Lachnospiraceae bacterium 54-53]